MAYCTVAQVEDLMQTKFTSVGKPPKARVEEIVDEVSGELDGVIEAAGYTLPITATAALALLRRYNTYGAAAAAWHAGFILEKDMPRVVYWNEEYQNFLSRLRRGEQYLPGISNDDASDYPAFGIAPAVRRENYWLTGEELD